MRFGWRGWFVTFGGVGLWPVMPGTLGSLAAAALFYLVYDLVAPSPLAWQLTLIAGLALASAATILLGAWANTFYNRTDPQPVVLDEVAGICLAWLMQPMTSPALGAFAVFLAFRLFDIAKPWPARRLEQLPGGWGILADDLASAIYANALCQFLLRVVWTQ